MIPKLLLAAVSAYLALEGYSLLTAPPSLVREALVLIRTGAEGCRTRRRDSGDY